MKHEEVVQMSIFTKISKKYKALTAKQFMIAGVFALGLAAAIGGGFASQQSSFADGQTIRDCGYYDGSGVSNSIDNYSGNGCGALNATELCQDMAINQPSDLQNIYNAFGLPMSECNSGRMQSEGKEGSVNRQGQLIVDGQVVADGVWTMGRTSFGNQRETVTVNGRTYYHSAPENSFASNRAALDAIVLFDKDGTVQFAALEACGNTITKIHKIPSGAECQNLNKTQTGDNSYSFTTTVNTFGFAKVEKLVYKANGVQFAETNDANKAVDLTITKDTTVTVEVTIGLPGNNHKTITAEICKRELKFKKNIEAVCKSLIATSSDNLTFRFTMITDANDSGVKAKSADFILDGKTIVTGVTTKNNDGNIFNEYTFSDEVEHTVHVKKVVFTFDGKDFSVTVPADKCVASVTPKQIPKCTKNPELPECKPCVPTATQDSTCHELPHTGPAGTAGLFAGVSALGAAVHNIVTKRRARRSE